MGFRFLTAKEKSLQYKKGIGLVDVSVWTYDF